MKRKEKRELIIGEKFNEKKGIISHYNGYNFYSLEQCYNTCSIAKRNIYDKYFKLIYDNSDRVLRYGVKSYNSMIITLEAEVIKDDKKYYLMITPSYNWFEELEQDEN